MVIIDVVVPSIGRKYNFSLDEAISVALLTEDSTLEQNGITNGSQLMLV